GELLGGGERAHLDGLAGGIAGAPGEVSEARLEGLAEGRKDSGGDEDPPGGGALLTCLLGQLNGGVADDEVPQLAALGEVRAEHDGVEAVGLDVDAHAASEDARVRADLGAGGGAAGEGDDVLR